MSGLKKLQIVPVEWTQTGMVAEILKESFSKVATRFNLTKENCPTHPSFCEKGWIDNGIANGANYSLLKYEELPSGCFALQQTGSAIAHLRHVAVLPHCQRQGYGSAMMRHAFIEAREREFKWIELSIISEHYELEQWYKKFGFIVKEKKRFEHLPFEVTVMVNGV